MVAFNSFVPRSEPDNTAIVTSFGSDPAENQWGDIQSRISLAKPNRDNACQTRVDYFNGESNLLDVEVPSILPGLPFWPQARESFDVKQKWEGYVLDVGEETFLARLIPLIGEGTDLEAEIHLEEIDREDRELVTPGAVFYWSIGYLKRPSGTYRTSFVRFQRLPPLGASELKEARLQAQQLLNLLDDEQPIYSTNPG